MCPGLQSELQAVTKRLRDSTQEVGSLRSQLASASQESQGLKGQLAKLSEQAAETDRRLNEEVRLHISPGQPPLKW